MELKLNIYTSEDLTEVKRVAEADRLKIPYRTAIYLISVLENVNIENTDDLLKLVTGAAGKLDKIVKATFGVTETELDCVDAGELVEVVKELWAWAMDKLKGIGVENGSKNA